MCLQCDSVIIFGTKTGVELTSFGIPVIVAGEAWIRNKGVTKDASSVEEYLQFLDELPLGQRMDEATTARARRYAYHFFFRRMIPLNMMEPTGGWPPYQVAIDSLNALRPGADAGLDVICQGILQWNVFCLSGGRIGIEGSFGRLMHVVVDGEIFGRQVRGGISRIYQRSVAPVM